jgi:2,4-dienoyl-CoA reductase-like NADH-dependent reductase (Old Yellow Enzyme family)
MARLFEPLTLGGVTFRNRVFVSPMCQYSSEGGLPTEWHFVHLGSRAVGGAGLVMVEASGVSPEARISPQDSGFWSEAHVQAFAPITRFIRDRGAVPGLQLAHAGRKASTRVPWDKSGPPGLDAWEPVAPSAIAFAPGYPHPRALDEAGIAKVIEDFRKAAALATSAGFQVVEIHSAHGYLLHEFLSPLSNQRDDRWGGSFENRTRLVREVARAVRAAFGGALFVRVSATDWAPGGWDLPQTIELARGLKQDGIDLIDCSSGGAVADAKIPIEPGYQVPFARAVRKEAGIATGAVGLITEPEQAEAIIASGDADAVLLARAMLRDPYWPLHAAHALGHDVPWPVQYDRAKPR